MKKQNFTLIELLVVIGIIGILFGILLPAVSSAMQEGKKTKAASTCRQIAMACESYKADYQINVDSSNTEMDFNAIREVFNAVTKAEWEAGNENNPRNKAYFSTIKDLLNPWEKPYYVQFDSDYNGVIDTSMGQAAGSVVVWTIDKSGSLIRSDQ